MPSPFLCGIVLLFVIKNIDSVTSDNDADAYLEEAGQIYSSILHKYNEKVRPPDSWPDRVAVSLEGTLWHIRNIDLMRQEMESLVELTISWRDKRLAWYPYKVNTISTNISTVWYPEIVYSNAALPPKSMLSAKVVISSEGYITWKRREIVTTLCPTDPFNQQQICSVDLKFVSPGNQEYFENSTQFTLTGSFSNHKWNVNTAELQFANVNQTEINFKLTLDRKAKLDQSQLVDDNDSNCGMNKNAAINQLHCSILTFLCLVFVTFYKFFH